MACYTKPSYILKNVYSNVPSTISSVNIEEDMSF